jgi:hypothetical protein
MDQVTQLHPEKETNGVVVQDGALTLQGRRDWATDPVLGGALIGWVALALQHWVL